MNCLANDGHSRKWGYGGLGIISSQMPVAGQRVLIRDEHARAEAWHIRSPDVYCDVEATRLQGIKFQ